MSKNKLIKFTLKSIRTDEFATAKSEGIVLKDVKLDTRFSFGLSQSTREVLISFKTTFDFQERSFIILQVSCEFQIEESDLKELGNPSTGMVTMPRNFMIHLCLITVGTARGVLHSKLENAEFNQYMLPVINVEEIVTKDIVFKMVPESQQQS